MPETEPRSPNSSQQEKSGGNLGLAVAIVVLTLACFWIWPVFLLLGIGLFAGFFALLGGIFKLIFSVVGLVLSLVFWMVGAIFLFIPLILFGALAVFVVMALMKLLRK